MLDLSQLLEPIAEQFRSLGIPEPITHWGHPGMMGIVVFVMGGFVGFTGWRRRVLTNEVTASELVVSLGVAHRRIALWMFLFMSMGAMGGLLSLVMQHQPILQSAHFWTSVIVLLLLATNGAISLFGFKTGKPEMRTAHAYLGSLALAVMFVHAVLGIKLGLAI
ncbi:MAG: DUF4079 domain-containing protein [Oscillatoriaceae bacterium SKW80]|nr:DUF4079 domain-containing protein [Oscillatoriaceae bacterium SKW80]HIK29419.1 DUF4079 domain-containing protein [Oscillatoriaceae cyanobacterium M7585_C2015_266]